MKSLYATERHSGSNIMSGEPMSHSNLARLGCSASTAALTVLLALFARPAAAQTFVEASLDVLTPSSSGATSATHAKGFGFSTGKLSKMASLETQFIYFSKLGDISGANVGSSHAFFFSGGYLIGPTIHQRYKVYGAIGFGEMHRRLSLLPAPGSDPSDPTSLTSDYFTLDGGAGVIVLLSRHFGVRAEIRKGRAFSFSDADDAEPGPFGIKFKHIDYWRASIGFVAAFGKAKPAPAQSFR